MRVDRIVADQALRRAGPAECARMLFSRRGFLQASAGAVILGAAATSGVARAAMAAAAPPGIGDVVPIPSTFEVLPGHHFHVLAPPFSGEDSDPITVFNFQGTSGLAYISGSVDRTDRKSGETRTLPFLFNDMRFMQGVFRGRDGHTRNATFAFI